MLRYGYGYPSYYSTVDEDDNSNSYGDWDNYEDYEELDEDYDVIMSLKNI